MAYPPQHQNPFAPPGFNAQIYNPGVPGQAPQQVPVMPYSPQPQGLAVPQAIQRYADLLNDQAYAPKSAPQKGAEEFEWTGRSDFEEGTQTIRFIAHPQLLPSGHHKYTTHKIPTAAGAPIKCLCTETWAPGQPCYICCLIKDLDDARNNKHDSILNPEVLGERVHSIITENATMYCRRILLPFIARGRVAHVPSTKDPTKSYRRIYPDGNQVCSGILALSPDKPNDYGNFADRPFDQRLSLLTMTDEEVGAHYNKMALTNPSAAAVFYGEAMGVLRNPNLFDAQYGSWLSFNKGKRGVAMSLTCMPPSPLDVSLITKYLSDKVYPNIREWGSGKGQAQGQQLSWYEALASFKNSWVGQELINRHGWDLDLDPNDWANAMYTPPMQQQAPPQFQQPAPPLQSQPPPGHAYHPPQQWQPEPAPQQWGINPNEIPF